MTKTAKEMKSFNAAIVTPYLTENLKAKGFNKEFIEEQSRIYGYDPQNLYGTRFLKTDRFFVRIHTGDESTNKRPDLVIIGSADGSEEIVESLKPSGIIVARYSIFYDGPSQYSGKTPEKGGYSLDLPKNVAVAKALLTHNGVLEAILAREEVKIKNALEDLNKTVSQPVLITPFLAEALKAR